VKISILALGSRGDILPYIVLGGGLRTAGHQVCMITFESFASLVATYGLEFHPIPGDSQEIVSRGGTNLLGLVGAFSSLANDYSRRLSLLEMSETDLMINQLPGGLYGYDLSEKYHIPMVLASVIPLARTNAFPLMGFPDLPIPGFNQFSYRVGEQIVWQMFRPVINRWRKNTLQLPKLSFKGYFDLLGTEKYPILNGFSPLIVPRPADWNEHIHLTGYWYPEEKEWEPPDDLLRFLDSGSPPVFFGFGSMPIKNPKKATETIIAALTRTGQRGMIHSGWSKLGKMNLPENVFRIDYVPYDWLFPRMGMIFHHGGAGTTAFGFRSGVPCCVVPFVFDQFYWGKRVYELGVGPEQIPYKRFNVPNLINAIDRCTQNNEMKIKATDLGNKMKLEKGVLNAVKIIEKMR